MTSIGIYAFWQCRGLTNIESEITLPFAFTNVFESSITNSVTLYVPLGTRSAYQSTSGWSAFKKIVEVGGVGYVFKVDNVNYKIGENNTASVTSSKNLSGDVVIQKQVTCNGVAYTVTSIEENAFGADMGCDFKMTSISIPNTITSIEFEAFPDMLGLKAVYITDLEAWCKISFNGDNSNPLIYAEHLFLNGIVTMFADANERNRHIRHRSRGLRAPCREAPPRCFS